MEETQHERYRREQWRHEVRLEAVMRFLAEDLRDGNTVDIEAIITTADKIADRMYPVPR